MKHFGIQNQVIRSNNKLSLGFEPKLQDASAKSPKASQLTSIPTSYIENLN